MGIHLKNADDTGFNLNTSWHDLASSNEFILYRIASLNTSLSYKEAAVWVHWQGAGLKATETLGNGTERHRYMNARGLMDILAGNVFPFCTENMTGKLGYLLRLLEVTSVSNASPYMI